MIIVGPDKEPFTGCDKVLLFFFTEEDVANIFKLGI